MRECTPQPIETATVSRKRAVGRSSRSTAPSSRSSCQANQSPRRHTARSCSLRCKRCPFLRVRRQGSRFLWASYRHGGSTSMPCSFHSSHISPAFSPTPRSTPPPSRCSGSAPRRSVAHVAAGAVRASRAGTSSSDRPAVRSVAQRVMRRGRSCACPRTMTASAKATATNRWAATRAAPTCTTCRGVRRSVCAAPRTARRACPRNAPSGVGRPSQRQRHITRSAAALWMLRYSASSSRVTTIASSTVGRPSRLPVETASIAAATSAS